MSLKVIGSGFGRTGTQSLTVALDQLGFRCYHMREVIQHPSQVPIWLEATRGSPVDWDFLFNGFQAAVDWPSSFFYKELMKKYPEAKVIHTVRDPEKWYESFKNTIIWKTRQTDAPPEIQVHVPIIKTLIFESIFQGRFEDKDYAIEVFNKNTEDVKKTVPSGKLLIFDVQQGWEPLCAFLNVTVPKADFPHINTTAAFQAKHKKKA